MKRKLYKILIPALCAIFIFAGCTTQQTSTSSSGTSSDAAVYDSQSDSNDTEVKNVSTQSTASDDFSDVFSDRDISGDYDEETFTIRLNGTSATSSADTVSISGSTVTITGAGTYIISGSLSNGSIIVNAGEDDKVQLVLSGVSINSDNYAAIYVKQADKVFITLADSTENTLSNGGSFTQTDDNNVDAVIFSKDDITFNGTGTLKITSPAGHGIVGKDEVTITSGTYDITAANHAISANDLIAVAGGAFTLSAGKDGLHSENSDDETLGNIYIADGTFTIKVSDDAIHANTMLQIDGGTFDITAAEGLEGPYIRINGGTIDISASDDGINAANKSSAYTATVEINDGEITIEMGSGDTDGVDSNGNIVINGGTIDVTGNSSFDCDGTAEYNGGTIIVNGQQVDSIPNQMMGGGMGGMGGMGRMHQF